MTQAASGGVAASEMDATCPFCGLLCDDLRVARTGSAIHVLAAGCELARRSFPSGPPPAGARIGGREATVDEAVRAAADILDTARAPLFGGLATDAAGMRAVMGLAERCGAVLDHMNAQAKFRNLLVLQEGGWITTTLAEVRNRADLLVLAGTDVVSRFPRFFERFVWVGETLFGLAPSERQVVYLGEGLDIRAGIAPDGRPPLHLACEPARLGEGFGVVRALLAGRRLDAQRAAGLPLGAWRELAELLAAARYAVIVWSAADLDFPHADLTVRQIAETIKDLNRKGRAAGLPLGGSDGDFTADGVQLWQTGYPFRSRLGPDGPDYDPRRYATAELLARGEADALLWIASFDPRRGPPAAEVPTIVLGHPEMRFEREPQVFLPVGTPGVDHRAHLFRTDKVVMLPLPRLREAGLASVADVVAAIENGMAKPC